MGCCKEKGINKNRSGCHWHPASVGRGADHGQDRQSRKRAQKTEKGQ